MTERWRILFGGKIEMPEPQLLVGERQKLKHRGPAAFRHLHVKPAREVQRADLFLPYEIEPIVTPTAGNFDDQLLVARTVVYPIVGNDDLFNEIDRVTRKRGWFDDRYRWHQALLGRLDWQAAGSTLPMRQG